jgi:hypothetical protein
MVGLTPYITPQMLLNSNFGISWTSFPANGASEPERIAALLDVCWTVTGEMDTIANLTLRATIDTETEFGPDWIITVLPNDWVRFRLSNWPITQFVSSQVSPAWASPPQWTEIPLTAMQTEHAALPVTGSTIPSGSGPGPTAALIAPGYVDWRNGRKGYLVQVTSINGFPTTGIDVAAKKGEKKLHVDDVTGWWNQSAGGGARGTIYDPPFREVVEVIDADEDGDTDSGDESSDDDMGISGPGHLYLADGLQFDHTPSVGSTSQSDQRILMTSMPPALIQAGHYLAVHYGLIRGTTAAVVQSGRGMVTTTGFKGAMDWYEQASRIIERYGRVL